MPRIPLIPQPREHIHIYSFAGLCAFYLVIFEYTAYFHIVSEVCIRLSYAKISFAIDSPRIYISIVVGIIILLLINPSPVLHRSSRFWLIKSLGRVLASGLLHVQFRDFFIADILNSITYSFFTLQIFICGLANGFDPRPICDLSNSWFVPFIVGLPPLFRFLQCIRRYRDTRDTIHIANAVKYSLSILVIWIGFADLSFWRRIIWIGMLCSTNEAVFALIRSVYVCYWDIQMDWTMFVGKKYRSPRLYPTFIYTPAIIFNIIFRFSWILVVIQSYFDIVDDLRALIYGISFFEMVRRAICECGGGLI